MKPGFMTLTLASAASDPGHGQRGRAGRLRQPRHVMHALAAGFSAGIAIGLTTDTGVRLSTAEG